MSDINEQRPSHASTPHADDPLAELRRQVNTDPTAKAAYEDEGRRLALAEEDETVRDGVVRGLIAARKAQKLNQTAVARSMGTVQSAISDIEKGRVDPQLRTLQRHARALNRRLDVAIVDDDLPTFEDGAANWLWGLVERSALSPLLTTLATQPSDSHARTLDGLKQATGVPKRALASILDSLQRRHWVTRSADDPPVYSLRDDTAAVIGVSVQRDEVIAVLSDFRGSILDWHPVSLADTSPQTVISATRRAVSAVYESRVSREVVAVGVSIAGVVCTDGSRKGVATVEYAPELESGENRWDGVHLEEQLQKDLQRHVSRYLRVAVENDANALAVSEYLRYGGRSVVAVLMTRNGIGAGLVFNGELIYGADSAAGEIGHLLVRSESGVPCRGHKHVGCLESIASPRGITARVSRHLTEAGLATSVDSIAEVEKHIAANPQVEAYFEEAGGELARALAASVLMLNPARVVIYGVPELVDADNHDGARAFQRGFEVGVVGLLPPPKEGSFVSPTWHWSNMHRTTNAQAAGIAAMRHFLFDPAHWQPTVLDPRSVRVMDHE